MSVDEEKHELRRIAKEGRSGWARTAGEGAAERLKENFLRTARGFPSRPESSDIIAGFWPMADEIDVRPLIAQLHEDGQGVALPVVVGSQEPLIFRTWEPGLALDDGGFGTSHPSPKQAEVRPGILLVPLLAFDAQGQRLGWGGGFYDRTLERLRRIGPRLAVGVAFAAQEVAEVPRDRYDQKLDFIVTEREVISIDMKKVGRI